MVDMSLSQTEPLNYLVRRQMETVDPVRNAIIKACEDTANIKITKNVDKIENASFKIFNYDDLSRDILSANEGVSKSFTAFKKLGDAIDFSNNYISVNKETVNSIEDTVIALDDTIDELENIIQNTSFGLNKFIMNQDLNRVLTLQFILSNKVADYYCANHKTTNV